jgi:hypothetical protein
MADQTVGKPKNPSSDPAGVHQVSGKNEEGDGE